jgi:hypothetical protein
METITVGYSRKTSKDFESFGVNGSVEFKPATQDMQKEIDQALLALKLILDPKLEEFAGKSGGALEDNGPDLGKEPEWVGKDPERIDALLGRGTVPPPPPPPSAQQSADSEPVPPVAVTSDNTRSSETDDNNEPSQPSVQSPRNSIDGQDVYLERAKVFRVDVRRSKTGKVFAELRVGHDDLSAYGFEEHYVTTRIFDPEYVAVVGSLTKMKNEETGQIVDVKQLLVNKNDFVNLWGKFSAWNTDATKFDINATAISKSQ